MYLSIYLSLSLYTYIYIYIIYIYIYTHMFEKGTLWRPLFWHILC